MRGRLFIIALIGLLFLTAGCRRAAAPEVASASLALEKQKYIWEIEHGAFQLEKKFGAAFRAAMSERDAEAVQGFFLPDFSGALLDPQRQATLDHGYLREAAVEGDAAGPLAADADAVARRLCDYFKDFKKVKKTKLRVLDLHAQDRNPESGVWTMTLLITGEGEDAQGEPIDFATEHRVRCRYLTDEEIEAGKIVDQWKVVSERFRHCAGPLFEEATAQFGLNKADIRDNWKIRVEDVRQYYTQMAVEDFNRDGYLDVAVASANGRWQLFQSLKGQEFRDVTKEVGLPQWSHEQPRSRADYDEIYLATWIDIDNDHYPDLILGDRVFRNRQGRSFEDVTESTGLHFGFNPRGCVVADYNCDGLLDLYVLYQHPREHASQTAGGWVGDDGSGAENRLWKNVGNGRFVNVTEAAGAGGGKRQSFAAVWLHANDDHYPDLYVANDFGTNSLLLNQGNGTFRDVSNDAGVADYSTSMGVAAGDITGDGAPEIYVANMFSKMGRRIIAHVDANDYPPGVFEQIKGSCAGNSMYSLEGDSGVYKEVSERLGVNQVGWAYAPTLADFDNDGWLDIYATTGFLSFEPHKPDG